MVADLQYCYREMLDELQRHTLQVVLAPAPEQRHSGHMIRVAVGCNPDWYKYLCSINTVKPAGRGKEYTKIVRGDIKRLLQRLSQGKPTNSKYCYDLEQTAREKHEEISEMERGLL